MFGTGWFHDLQATKLFFCFSFLFSRMSCMWTTHQCFSKENCFKFSHFLCSSSKTKKVGLSPIPVFLNFPSCLARLTFSRPLNVQGHYGFVFLEKTDGGFFGNGKMRMTRTTTDYAFACGYTKSRLLCKKPPNFYCRRWKKREPGMETVTMILEKKIKNDRAW